ILVDASPLMRRTSSQERDSVVGVYAGNKRVRLQDGLLFATLAAHTERFAPTRRGPSVSRTGKQASQWQTFVANKHRTTYLNRKLRIWAYSGRNMVNGR